MRKYLVLLAALLAACSPAQSDETKIGRKIARMVNGAVIFEFTTPQGHYCLYVDGYKQGGLSCQFKEQ